MKLNLMNLFDGYVRNYHTFNLTMQHGKHSFTMTEIEYFSRLGSMLGFDPFTEDTCNGTYRPMDLTWWGNYNHADEYWYDFVLHLERENLFSKDEETLDKLYSTRENVPTNVIGIMNVQNRERIEHLVKKAAGVSSIENSLLVFRTSSLDRNKAFLDGVHAYLFKRDRVVESKLAYISEVSGTLFMHFERELSRI
jgi:hypothetical protein